MLIDDLKAIQERRGFLPHDELLAYSDRTNTPLYQIQAVASFYPHFRLQPPPATEIHVCTDLSCHLRGAPSLLERLKALARPSAEVHPCSCLGQCDAGPALMVNDVPVRRADLVDLEALLAQPLALPPAAEARVQIDPYE